MEDIFLDVSRHLMRLKQSLNLEALEMLSTVMFSLYNKVEDELFVVAIGDGLVVINGESFEIDQNNTPDYMAYHLPSIGFLYPVFQEWYEKNTTKFRQKGVKDFTISTDGILSFKKIKAIELPQGIEEHEPVSYLTKDQTLHKSAAMLGRKCNILENQYGNYHMDDLSLIRVIVKEPVGPILDCTGSLKVNQESIN